MNFKKCIMSVSVALILISPCITKNVMAQYIAKGPILTFSVMSDVHSNAIKFTDALKDLHDDIDSNLSTMVLNGDITDQGLQSQYDLIKNILINNSVDVPEQVIYVMGNHEYYDYAKGPNSDTDIEMFKKRFLKNTGLNSIYYDKWIKNYHFIVLCSEKTYTKELGTTKAVLSQTQLNWLKEKMAEKYQKGKPIFVFLHQPLKNTVTASDYYNDCIEKDAQLKSILTNYPETLFFTSHTHRNLALPNAFVHDKFYMINTCSVNNPEDSNTDGSNKEIGGSQGLYVEVFKDKVEIKGREFSKKSWITGADFTASFINKQ